MEFEREERRREREERKRKGEGEERGERGDSREEGKGEKRGEERNKNNRERGKNRRRIESVSEFILPHIIPVSKHKSGGLSPSPRPKTNPSADYFSIVPNYKHGSVLARAHKNGRLK